MAMPLCESCKDIENVTSTREVQYASKVVQTTPLLGLRFKSASSYFRQDSPLTPTSRVSPDDVMDLNDNIKPSSPLPTHKKKSRLMKGAFKSLMCSFNDLIFSNQNKKWFPQRVKKLSESKNKNTCIPSATYIDDDISCSALTKDENEVECTIKYLDEEDNASDINWGRDANSCVVCERVFLTIKELERHQLKKRHYGCSECERRFNTFMLLEYHKEEFGHWSDEDFSSLDDYDSDDSSNQMDLDEMEYDEVSRDEEKEFLLL